MRTIKLAPAPKQVIAIVEDDESLRRALVGLLRSMAHEARGFGSAEAFLASGDGPSACVITDVQLPGMSGIELTRSLRRRGDPVPVIMITAQDIDELAPQVRDAGTLCLLRKPFEMQDLLDCLDRALAA